MRKLFARWFFAFATFNIWIASLIDEAETSALLAWFYTDLIKGAKETLAKLGVKNDKA
jgi:hypothetical protein